MSCQNELKNMIYWHEFIATLSPSTVCSLLARTAICIEIIESGLAAIRSFTFQKEESTVLCIKWKAVSSHLLLVERHDVGSNAGYARKKYVTRK